MSHTMAPANFAPQFDQVSDSETLGRAHDAAGSHGAQPPSSGDGARRPRLRVWRNRFVVLLMIGGAVFAGNRFVRAQMAKDAKLDLGQVALTSQPVGVQTSMPGLVTRVDVAAGDHVFRGERLGLLQVTTTDAQGKPVISFRQLTAPRAGIVVNDPLTVGSVLQPGLSFVDLYDPRDLELVTDVPLSLLPKISAGMTADLQAEGLSKHVTAVLKRAVPRVGNGQAGVAPDHLELVFVPRDPAQVATLIPGLRFSGLLDTRTGKTGSTRAVYVS